MRIVTWFFAIIGFFTVLCVALAGYGVFVVSHRHRVPEIAGNSILRLNLNQPFSETEDDSLHRLSGGKTENFQALLATLRAAATDNRIKGLVATGGESTLGFAQIQEFRDTLAMFRAKGKFAYGFAESEPGQRAAIAAASRVTNPGCWSTGAIALLRPLVRAGIVPADWPISIHGVTPI